ncbi:MAG: T9SS type A sorting domain-containing protein [Bacteroidota bacterium]
MRLLLLFISCCSSYFLMAQPAGTLDETFGNNGRVLINYSNQFTETLSDVALQSDGKIVVAGITSLNNGTIVLARYLANGSVDASFGNNGRVIFQDGSFFNFSLAIQPDDKLVFTGSIGNTLQVHRYTANGQPDTTFGDNGRFSYPAPASMVRAGSVDLQSDGKIIVAGHLKLVNETARSYLFFRLTPAGALDESFGTDGSTIIFGENASADLNGMRILGNDKIVATGKIRDNGVNMITMRLSPAGVLDTSFAENGISVISVSISDDDGWDILPAGNGDFIVGGRSINTRTTHTDFLLVKYLEDGTLDLDFGEDGIVITDPPGSSASLFTLLPQPNGGVLAGGATRTNSSRDYDLLLIRYLANGALDPTFGTNGMSITDLGNSADWLWDITLTPSGDVIGCGRSDINGDFDALTVRYSMQLRPDFTLSTNAPPPKEYCAGDTLAVEITLDTLGGFAETITVDFAGLPAGTVTSPNLPITTQGGDTTVLLNFVAVPTGTYPFAIIATAGEKQEISSETISNLNESPSIPNLLDPTEGSLITDITLSFSWTDPVPETVQTIEFARSPAFDEIVLSIFNEGSGLTLDTDIFEEGRYYWRVISRVCGQADTSAVAAFKIPPSSCVRIQAEGLPIPISAFGTDTIISPLTLTEDLPADLEGFGVFIEVDHQFLGDLSALLRAPDGTEFPLFDRPGFPRSPFGCAENGLQVTFTDAAEATAEDLEQTCDPAGANDFSIKGKFQPLGGSLTDFFAATETIGTWELVVIDHLNFSGGFLTDWGIEVCAPAEDITPLTLSNTPLEVMRGTTGTISQDQLLATADANAAIFYLVRGLPTQGTLQLNGNSLAIGDTIMLSDVMAGRLTYTHTAAVLDDDFFLFDVVADQCRWLPWQRFTFDVVLSSAQAPAPETASIIVYPNPVDKRLHISGVPAHELVEISVFDQLGQRLVSIQHQQSIAVEQLPAGVYIVRLQTRSGWKQRRIVVK